MEEDYIDEINEYYEDIFSTKPSSFTPLVGYDKIIDDVIYWVKSGNMVFLEGREGFGKTSIMLQIIEEFKGEGKVVYLDCMKIKKNINIEHLLTEKYGMLGKVLKILPNEMIVLLDNIQYLSKKNSERIKFFFDNNNIKSVVFSAENAKDVEIHDSVFHRIGKRKIKLPKLNSNSAVDILYTRVEENELMDATTINRLYTLSKHSPKLFLQNCMTVFEFAEINGRKKIYSRNLQSILK